MAEKLAAMDIPCKLITDSAIAVALEEVDFVLVGAEAVVENGGIINRVFQKIYNYILSYYYYFYLKIIN